MYNKNENSQCSGCSILNTRKPFYCARDYINAPKVDILFITDSYRYNGWEKVTLSEQELDFFNEAILPMVGNFTYAFTPAVKCPTVKDSDMNATNSKICRAYLEESVKAYNPKLIIPLGNLAFKMLTKKSGMAKHHGSEFRYNEIPVVPTYNISIIFIEPKYLDNIVRDIEGAINKFIQKVEVRNEFEYSVIASIADLKSIYEGYSLHSTTAPIAIDVETTGLNLLTDKVLTIALSFKHEGKYLNYCIPLEHKESPLSEEDRLLVINYLEKICNNNNNVKIMHNCKFDMRMLGNYGIKFANVWDTKSMAHSVDEYQQLGLKHLVKRYLPGTLEVL